MAGVAVVKTTCRQVKHAHEERHEHICLVHVGHRVVHQGEDAAWRCLVGRDGAEQTARHGHHERCRNAFSRDVADAEEEFFVANVEVVEVTTHFLRRHERGKDFHVVALGIRWENLRQHSHLNGTGNVQLAANALFLGIDFLKSFVAAHGAEEDIRQQSQSDQHQQEQVDRNPAQTAIDVAIAAYDDHRPSRAALHWRVEDVVLLALFVDDTGLATVS